MGGLLFISGIAYSLALVFAVWCGRAMNPDNSQLNRMEERLMALSDEVKAFAADVSAKADAAIADIQALHVLVSGALDQGDVAGAQAAMAEASAKLSALAEAVAVPE